MGLDIPVGRICQAVPRTNYRKSFEKLEGNYVMGRPNGETGETEYYVGETEDFYRRLVEHEANGWSLVSFLSNTGGKKDRLKVEHVQQEAWREDGQGDVVNGRGRGYRKR